MTRKIDPETHRFIHSDDPVPCKITACFTDYELSLIEECAKNDKVTVSEFMRRMVIEKIREIPKRKGK